jgi:hypothetical protein
MEAPQPRNASSHRVRGPDGANSGSYPLGERQGADMKVQAGVGAGTNTRASTAMAAPSVRTLAQLAVALGRDAGTLLRLSAATLNAVIDEAVSEGHAVVGALARHELHEELARSGTVTAAAAAAASPGLTTTPDANAAAWHQYYQQQQYWQYYQQQQFQAAQQQMSSMHLDEQDCGSADSR